MNALIREALGLGNADWPPDYYALLGLTPETANPESVESAVLDRMEKLRAYQIAHPEPVTEAMNLLARALEALADPAGRQHYDVERSTEPAVSPPLPVEERVYLVHPATPRPPRVIAPQVKPVARLPRTETSNRAAARGRVRHIVADRRMLDAWDAAGPFLASPTYVPPTRFTAIEIVAALRRVAALSVEGSNDAAGGAVLALAHSPLTTHLLFEMSEARRELLAEDWRSGRQNLLGNYRQSQKRVGRRTIENRLRRWLRRGRLHWPKMIAATTATLAVVVAIYRWLA